MASVSDRTSGLSCCSVVLEKAVHGPDDELQPSECQHLSALAVVHLFQVAGLAIREGLVGVVAPAESNVVQGGEAVVGNQRPAGQVWKRGARLRGPHLGEFPAPCGTRIELDVTPLNRQSPLLRTVAAPFGPGRSQGRMVSQDGLDELRDVHPFAPGPRNRLSP